MASKKLYRSRTDSILAGICGGLAAHFGQDATWWRLGFAAFLIVTGFMPGLLIYIVAWILIPLAPKTSYDYDHQ